MRRERLEADEEAEAGFAGVGAAVDGQVVCPEVRCEVDELAETETHTKMVCAAGEVLLDAEVVVVDGAVLEGQALAAAGGGREVEGSATSAEVGLDAVDLARVGDVAEGDLVDAGLRTGERNVSCGGDGGRGRVVVRVDGRLGGSSGERIILGETGVAKVVLEADIRLAGIAQGDQLADRAAGGDGEKIRCCDGGGRNAGVLGVDSGNTVGVLLLNAADVRTDDAGDADAEVKVLHRALEGSGRNGFLCYGLRCGEAEKAQGEQAGCGRDRTSKRIRHVLRTPLRQKMALL